ncbi:TPA: DUF3048 domain-containing protein [Candidatus Saccharibacteria bacterium]|nr:DUF3048 domain-containing protein [Candidatus Saccharibacteria bacterium]HRK41048.1 DUF3048 domain-containing protein [Candidatus Saccharibacteria bacterium]
MLPIKALPWTRLHQFLHDNHGVRYFVAAVGILLATGLTVIAWMWQQPVAQTPTIYATAKPEPEPPKYYSPLTGAVFTDEAPTKRHVTAVMIENSPDARPQSGLKEAGIVYEAIAEGGITRFLALYQESRPGLVGPVRSVRPYYVEWGAAYDPGVAHIGGSRNALSMIRSGQYGVDLDQFFNAGAYWRAKDRYAPHNVYTNFDRLDALSSKKNKTASTFKAIERKDDSASKSPNATHIDLPISSRWYNVDYNYDAASNSYKRGVGGEAHNDREAGQITPKVVVAIQVSMTRQLEDGYREQIRTTGSGKAWLFQDGTVTEATWQRPDVKSQLVLVGADGKPLKLNRGQTWITALSNQKVPAWR